MLELKIIMALTCRSFTAEDGYELLDRKLGRRPGGCIEAMGGRAYQVLLGSAKPKDGMPVRVKATKR
jgi:hypothetical protein